MAGMIHHHDAMSGPWIIRASSKLALREIERHVRQQMTRESSWPARDSAVFEWTDAPQYFR